MAHLVAVAHGTRNPHGRSTIERLAADLARLRPEVTVHLSYVDVQEPSVASVTHALAGTGEPVVVVPLLLSVGYHVRVDIARAVDACPGAVAAEPLGPDPALVDLLQERLEQAGARGPVVLASAGSSDPDAAVAVEQVRVGLAARWPNPVTLGFGAAATPTVPQAVSAVSRDGAAVAIAPYLLAPGHFHDQLLTAGAEVVAGPLGPDSRLADLALRRVEVAAERLPSWPANAI